MVVVLAGVVVFGGMAALGVVFLRATWRGRFSSFDRGGIFSQMFGLSARSGYDASSPIIAIAWGFGLLSLTVAALPDLASSVDWMGAGARLVLVRIAMALLGGGLVVSWSLLLLLRPRWLVPPHLRGERGWIPELAHRYRRWRAARR